GQAPSSGQPSTQRSTQQPSANQTQGQANAPTRNQTQTGAAATQGTSNATIRSASGRVNVTAEQQTRIRQSVLTARNAPRVNRVTFALNVGVVVPSRVRVASFSTFPVLVEAFPEFRDDQFFVADDDIVVVDRSHRVVDVVPAGPRSRF